MKITFLFSFLLLISLPFVQAQEQFKSDRELDGYKGPVIRVKETSLASVETYGQPIVERAYPLYEVEYDETGNKRLFIEYNSYGDSLLDGALGADRPAMKRRLRYDEEGRIIEEIFNSRSRTYAGCLKRKTLSSQDGQVLEERNYADNALDPENQEISAFLVKEASRDESGNLHEWGKIGVREYRTVIDPQGNTLESRQWYEGNYINRTEWKYNRFGKATDVLVQDSTGGLTHKTVIQYDDQGRKIEQIEYDGNGVYIGKSEWIYDASGTVVEYIGTPAGGLSWSRQKWDGSGDLIFQDLHLAFGEYIVQASCETVIVDSSDAFITTKTQYNDRGIPLRIEEWIYDKNQNIMSQYIDSSISPRLISHQWKYDEKGNVIEETDYGFDGILNSNIRYKYNEQNRLIEKIEYNGGGVFYEWLKYQIDESGNLERILLLDRQGTVIYDNLVPYGNNFMQVETTFDSFHNPILIKEYYPESDTKYTNYVFSRIRQRTYVYSSEVENSLMH